MAQNRITQIIRETIKTKQGNARVTEAFREVVKTKQGNARVTLVFREVVVPAGAGAGTVQPISMVIT